MPFGAEASGKTFHIDHKGNAVFTYLWAVKNSGILNLNVNLDLILNVYLKQCYESSLTVNIVSSIIDILIYTFIFLTG